MSPRRRRLLLGVAALGALTLGVVLMSSLRDGGDRRQEQASGGHPGRPTGLGRVGTLPDAPTALAKSGKLTAPEGIIEVPGRHRLGSVVTFQVPVRNDGSETLVIDKVNST